MSSIFEFDTYSEYTFGSGETTNANEAVVGNVTLGRRAEGEQVPESHDDECQTSVCDEPAETLEQAKKPLHEQVPSIEVQGVNIQGSVTETTVSTADGPYNQAWDEVKEPLRINVFGGIVARPSDEEVLAEMERQIKEGLGQDPLWGTEIGLLTPDDGDVDTDSKQNDYSCDEAEEAPFDYTILADLRVSAIYTPKGALLAAAATAAKARKTVERKKEEAKQAIDQTLRVTASSENDKAVQLAEQEAETGRSRRLGVSRKIRRDISSAALALRQDPEVLTGDFQQNETDEKESDHLDDELLAETTADTTVSTRRRFRRAGLCFAAIAVPAAVGVNLVYLDEETPTSLNSGATTAGLHTGQRTTPSLVPAEMELPTPVTIAGSPSTTAPPRTTPRTTPPSTATSATTASAGRTKIDFKFEAGETFEAGVQRLSHVTGEKWDERTLLAYTGRQRAVWTKDTVQLNNCGSGEVLVRAMQFPKDIAAENGMKEEDVIKKNGGKEKLVAGACAVVDTNKAPQG